MPHKVFISYASEDKDRFVLGFATKLRERAVDAWVADWEIALGDSIVRRIFDEGLGKADAVVIVLSNSSVNKPWVRAELDVAKVKQVEQRTKIIPVILDSCEVPTPLQGTRWEKIHDLNNYEQELNRIVMSIHGLYDRPPLGSPPAYGGVSFMPIRNLPSVASLALKLCYDKQMECPGLTDSESIITQMGEHDIARQEAIKALKILEHRHYLKGVSTFGVEIFLAFEPTSLGLQTYIDAYISDFGNMGRDVLIQLVNYGREDSSEIARILQKPHLLVQHIFRQLETRNLAKVEIQHGGSLLIWNLSPELEFMLQDGSLTP